MGSYLTSAANGSRRPAATSAAGDRRVVVAGGHSLVRATRCSLAERAGLRVVADTADTAVAADAAGRRGASLALVDLGVEGGCVPAVRKLVERVPGIAVLVVAPELDPRVLLAVVRAGAEGLVTESAGAAGFARAVEAALHGESVIPRDGVAALIDEVRAQADGGPARDPGERKPPEREAEVLVPLRRRRAAAAVVRQARPAARALESMS